MIAQIMKRLILMIAAIWSVAVCLSAQGFGYSYGAGREDVQVQTPMAVAGADRPEDIWAVSGNMQPFGTCANDADTPPYGSSHAGRRNLPTTGGTDRTNPDVKKDSPIGDMDWVCWLLLGGYLIGVTARGRRRAKQANTLCDNKA